MRAMRTLPFLAILAAACGGNVVYVDDGGGGSGSGASGPVGPGTTSGPTTNTSVSATSVTTGFMSTCQAVCSAASQCFEGNCLDQCASLYVPGCDAVTDAFLLCAIANLPAGQCEISGNACESEAMAYDACVNGTPPPPPDCSQSSCAFEVCWCSADCFGGTLVADCDDFGPSNCRCYFDDQLIGTCDGQTCQVEQSCCYDLLLGGAPD